MTWSYNNGVTPGVLTSTGATEASPDSLLAGIAIVQAANAARGYRNGPVAWINDVEVRLAGTSFIVIDSDSQIDLRGSSFINPQSGGVIHDWRSTLIISTTTSRVDAALDFQTGATFISRRQRPNDPSPRIVYNTSVRHDYPTILNTAILAKVQIDGLDLYGSISGGGSNLKVYFGLATISSVANVRFFSTAGAQQFSTIYNDGYYERLTFDSELIANTVVQTRPTYYSASQQALSGSIRAADITLNNPTFLNNCWNGLVSLGSPNAASRLALQYSYTNTFKTGLTPVEGVNVGFTRARQSVTGSPTWTAPNATQTATSNAQGTYTALSLLDAYREGTSGTDIERFNHSMKARTHNTRTAGEYVYANRVLYQHSVNMSAGYNEEAQQLPLAFAPATLAAGLAITGVTFDSAGNCTSNEDHTALELFHAWCSASRNNLDMPDVWRYDGTTLTMGAANLSGTGIATGEFATTGTITATVNGSFTAGGLTRVTIRTPDNLALSTYLTVDGVPQAWQVGQTSRNIFVTPTSVVRIYVHAYGYQPKIVNITGNTATDYIVSLLPETNVDTTLDTTTRDTVAAGFAVGVDAFSRIFLSVAFDMRPYTPPDVLNALHYFTVTQGALIAAAATAANSVDGFALIRGGFVIRSPGFYGKVSDAVTEDTDMGLYVPLYVLVDPSVYVADPTFTPVKKNSSGVVLGVALWTQQEADVPTWVAQQASVLSRATQTSVDALVSSNQIEHDVTQAAIAALPAPLDSTQTQAAAAAALVAYDGVVPADLAGLALESSVQTRATQTSVNAIPTNPLLTTDTRLNNLDAAISTRSTLTAPQVRTELATELARIDVATSTRLATAGYTAPANADIAAIKAKTDTLVNGPTLLQIEGSTVLAKEASVTARPTLAQIEASTVLAKQSNFTGLATATNVTNAQTTIVTEVNANETKIDAIKVDTAAIKSKTDTLNNAPTVAQIRTEMETTGSKLDTAAKKAKAAWVNTL